MNNETVTHKDFFFCYDMKLTNSLIRNGHNFITYAIHPMSHKTFYMFQRSEGLSEFIDSYKKEKGRGSLYRG